MNKSNFASEFAILTSDRQLKAKRLSPTFYQELEIEFAENDGYALISQHHFIEDWPTWEVHPSGDEFVTLIEGDMTLVLRQDNQDKTVHLNQPGDHVRVPAGVWHTAKTHAPTTMLFVTPGAGTLNAASPPI